MNIFDKSDLLLQKNVTLYNNKTCSGSRSGRLLLTLEIFPTPRIFWDYEELGEDAVYNSGEQEDGYIEIIELEKQLTDKGFTGNGLTVSGVEVIGTEEGPFIGQLRRRFYGRSRTAYFGNVNQTTNAFTFYLPNAYFQSINCYGQGIVSQEYIGEEDSNRYKISFIKRSAVGPGRIVDFNNDLGWRILILTLPDSMKWINKSGSETGTLITTIGKVIIPDHQVLVSLQEAYLEINTLCHLLSFVNGGYISPIFFESEWLDDTFEVSGMALAPKVTPVQNLGKTWFGDFSDIQLLLKTLPSFKRLLKLKHWQNDFFSILDWYFQAIQPQDLHVGEKPWPIVANALGAALEKACFIILDYDLGCEPPKPLREKISDLLSKMGVNEDESKVSDFVRLRNDATHSEVKTNFDAETIEKTLAYGKQWLEEILLWRLGYSGEYFIRSIGEEYRNTPDGFTCRYDITRRGNDW